MNHAIADLVASPVPATPDPAGATAAKPDAGGGDLFRSTLASRLAPVLPPLKPAAAPAGPAVTLQALQTKIGAMLAAGASPSEVADVLAKGLAAKAATALGAPSSGDGGDLREKLQTVFATALAPPGAAGLGPAEQARILAQRYERVAAAAETLAETQNGQQKRFSGTILDAHRAKDNPALVTATKDNPALMSATAQHSSAPAGAHRVASPNAGDFAAFAAPLAYAAGTFAAPATAHLTAPAHLTDPQHTGLSGDVPATPDASANPSNALAAALPFPLTVPPAGASLAVNSAGREAAAQTASGHSAHAPSVVMRAPSTARATALPSSNPGSADAADPLPAGGTANPAAAATAAANPAADGAGKALDVASALPALVSLPTLPGIGAGDGRRVNLGSTAARATGGDNGLGRILTRASLAADARESAAGRGPARAVLPAGTPAPSTAGASRPGADAGLSSFIEKFEAALHAATPNDALRPPPPEIALPVAAHAAPDAANAAAAAPFAIERPDATAPASPHPAPPPAPAVDHSAIADQVLRGAFMRSTGTSSEMRLTLVPETLGDVTVKLVVSSGSVTAHVLAQTPEVRDALVAAQPQLTKSLADAGLKLTAFNVDLSGGFAGFAQQQRQDENPSGRQSRRANMSLDATDAADESALEAIPSFGPSSVAQAAPGDFNHLA